MYETDYIWSKKEPILKQISVFNGSGVVTIENNPKTFGTLPHGSPVEFEATRNKFLLLKGFEAYATAATSATQKITKEHLVGAGDLFTIGSEVEVLSVDTSNADYDTVVFDASVSLTAGVVYSQVPDGKVSLTSGQCPIDNNKTENQCFTGVLNFGIIDTEKLIMPAILPAANLLSGIQNVNDLFV